MKISLIGYGQMGKMLHQLGAEKGFEICSIIDPMVPGCQKEISKENLNHADVAIEFSHPGAVVKNLEHLIELKQCTVVGTTGWQEEMPHILKRAEAAGIGFVYGSNFSLGMNLFSRIIASAVQTMDLFEDYDILAWEKHHARKADSPSGTAVELAKLILEQSTRKQKVVWDRMQRKPNQDELHFASIRGGSIPGTHSIAFDSPADSIELSHIVRSRATFALGALQAAAWIAGKTGIFSFNEVIEDILC